VAAYTSYGVADEILWRLMAYEVYGGLWRRLGALGMAVFTCGFQIVYRQAFLGFVEWNFCRPDAFTDAQH